MVIAYMKNFTKYFVLLFLSISVPLSSSIAQLEESKYEMYPKVKSYLNQPEMYMDQNLEGLNLPQVTEQGEKPLEEAESIPTPEERPLSIVNVIDIDKKIDPKTYILGPTDLIGVYLWGELDRDFRLRVTPEGKLIIPTVGAVQIADLSLADAKEVIRQAVAKKYKTLDVTVYLAEPRWFNVYVSGVVKLPGAIRANSFSRISDIYLKASPIVRPPTLTLANKRGSSLRNIVIMRNDRQIAVDLLKFQKMGDLESNPYLVNGDRIMINEYSGDISALGEVNNSGVYEFRKGDRIKDLVKFGGGLTTLADSAQATLVRFKDDGFNLDYIKLNLEDALINNPDSPEFLLKEGDRLYVPTRNDYKRYTSVVVSGAVRNNGQFAIVHHATKLSDAINMAGGLTQYADLTEARLIRAISTATRDAEFDRLSKVPVAEMTDDEYEYYKQRARTAQGLINADFVAVFEKNDSSKDIILEPGDNIFIPMKREMVEVIGAVKYPGNLKIEKGKDFKYYIAKAGGTSWNADIKKIRIVKGKTGQRFKPASKRDLEPGDSIFIPEKKPKDYWELFRETTLIMANVATAVIVAKNIIE